MWSKNPKSKIEMTKLDSCRNSGLNLFEKALDLERNDRGLSLQERISILRNSIMVKSKQKRPGSKGSLNSPKETKRRSKRLKTSQSTKKFKEVLSEEPVSPPSNIFMKLKRTQRSSAFFYPNESQPKSNKKWFSNKK